MLQFAITLIIGNIIGVIIIIYLTNNISRERKVKYGFKWFRYDLRDWTHKYVGEYLYACERVPFLDTKIDDLPKTKGE